MYIILALYFLLLCQSTRGAQTSVVTFKDITTQAGIDFRYTFGDVTYESILESSGSGITVFDYDGDGHFDLYIPKIIFSWIIEVQKEFHFFVAHLERAASDICF